MFADYEKLVLEDYRSKKVAGKLSSNLTHPTPANLKNECLQAYKDRFQKRDEKTIRDFFVSGGKSESYLQMIETCDINKFRPIINYLKKDGAKRTKEKNISLLAWLIDFEDRPFVFGKKYEASVQVAEITDAAQNNIGLPKADILESSITVGRKSNTWKMVEDAVEDSDTNEYGMHQELIQESRQIEISSISDGIGTSGSVVDFKQVKPKLQIRKTFVFGVMVLISGVGSYWWWNINRSADSSRQNSSCMYWTGDHYQPIPCNQKMSNTLVIAIDTTKVKNFKKITLPDTITNRAKGRIWYSKINNKVEFFTSDGEHPTFIGRRLKPITDYIIQKYIDSGRAVSQ